MQRLFLGMTPFWGVEAGPLACTWLSDRPQGLGWRLPALLTGRARFLSPEAGFFSRRGETLFPYGGGTLGDRWRGLH